jgi:hypothetical protein
MPLISPRKPPCPSLIRYYELIGNEKRSSDLTKGLLISVPDSRDRPGRFANGILTHPRRWPISSNRSELELWWIVRQVVPVWVRIFCDPASLGPIFSLRIPPRFLLIRQYAVFGEILKYKLATLIPIIKSSFWIWGISRRRRR